MKDMTGYRLSVYDWVVFPRMVGESPVLAFGVVKKVGAKAIIVWTGPAGVSVVLTSPEAVLSVEPENVPDDIYHDEIYRD